MITFKEFYLNEEDKSWWKLLPEVTLYHGTSSVFLDDIKVNGIKTIEGELKDYIISIMEDYIGNYDFPSDEYNKIIKEIISTRKDVNEHKISNVIYTTTSFKQATEYARYYYKLGGEIGYDIYKILKQWFIENKNIHLKERFYDAKPVVLKLQIPSKWMITSEDVNLVLSKAKDSYESLKDWYNKRDKYFSFDSYISKEYNFEVRIDKNISPSMIKKIIYV